MLLSATLSLSQRLLESLGRCNVKIIKISTTFHESCFLFNSALAMTVYFRTIRLVKCN